MSNKEIILIARDLENAINKYKSQNYIDDDLLNYCRKLLKQGKIEEAVAAWNNRIPKEMGWIWGKTMQDYMEWFTEERTPAEVNLAAAKISVTTQQVKNIILESNKAFMTDVIGQYYKDLYGMADKELYNTVLEASVSQFRTYIDGALSNTPTAILNDIRQFQLDIHEYNHLIGKSSDLSQYIDETEKMFRERMERKFPSYFQAMKDGDIIKSRWYGPNLDKVKCYTLDEYTEMMARPTVLNVDRAAALADSISKGHRVMQYVVRDNRPLETEEREICRHILDNKIGGKALLALDDEAARLLGINTVTSAKTQGAMAIHCRHGIVPVSDSFEEQIEKIIFLKQQVVSAEAS